MDSVLSDLWAFKMQECGLVSGSGLSVDQITNPSFSQDKKKFNCVTFVFNQHETPQTDLWAPRGVLSQRLGTSG